MKDLLFKKLQQHASIANFTQNADIGDRKNAAHFRVKQTQVLQWWLYNQELEDDQTFSEQDCFMLQAMLMCGDLDGLIYYN